jgi:glycosyltransferase involved in cell wall biosynthesis
MNRSNLYPAARQGGVGDDARPARPPSPFDPERTPSISAIVPAYNEEAVIERAVLDLAGILGRLTTEYEIVVVDDGSRDRTASVLAGMRGRFPGLPLRIVTPAQNRGYGAALASGFDSAAHELIFITDGDRQFDVAELQRFLAALDPQTDLVIGWRVSRADPLPRLLNAWGWKLLVNAMFGYTARDVDCAFKLFRRRVWERTTVHAHGATFSAELLVKARRLGFQVKELPVRHLPRTAGTATGARLDVIARAFQELFQLWHHLDRELVEDGARWRLSLASATLRAPS